MHIRPYAFKGKRKIHTAAPTAFATSRYLGLMISPTPAIFSAIMMLPPPTRITFASPCLVLTRSIAVSTAREISRSPDFLTSGDTELSMPGLLKTRSVA
jgi:hypothetical protein